MEIGIDAYNGLSMWPDFRRALRLIPRQYRWQWALIVPLAFAAAMIESLGAGVALTLGTVLAEPDRLSRMPGLTRAFSWLPSFASGNLMTTLSACVIVFYLARAGLLTLFAWAQQTVVQRTAADVARRLFGAYMGAPYAFHLRRNSATLIQTAHQSVDMVLASGLGSAVNIATESLTLLALLAVLAFAAPLATVFSIATISIILLVPFIVIRRAALRLGRSVKILNEALLLDLQQSLSSFKEVRVMGAAGHFEAAYAGHRSRLASLRAHQEALSTGVRVFVETTFIVAILAALIFVTARGASGGTLIGLMALYGYVGFRVVPSANRLMLNFTVFQGARPHVQGLCADLAMIEPAAAIEPGPSAASALPFQDRIALESIHFRYDQGGQAALEDVSLAIRRGESVGIIGPTAAGKSTLIDVLLGLLEPQSGRVLVDGRDIRGHLPGWQARIGYVPQTFALLDDTIRRNIAFGRSDAAIDDSRIEAALRLAHLTETVARLPQGLGTAIGERGARLSGGERQRLAIARALYHDPDVLVFDEATSALDHQTEQAIVRAIDDLRGVKTLIVIAHRLTTVRGCDRIVVLHEGRITADGPYSDIVEHQGSARVGGRVP